MDKQEFLDRFMETFAGRRDLYAVGKPHRNEHKRALGKLEYFPVYEPLTEDVLMKHIIGRMRVGLYPLNQEQKVKFFALDFDGDTFEQAYQEACDQRDIIERAGLHVYLERSQSGIGVHLWGFFDEWVSGEEVRDALLPLFLKQSTGDRMYPVQRAALKGKKMGNLIALPFYDAHPDQQNTQFLDRDGNVIPPREFLASLKLNTPAVLATITPPKRPKPTEFERKELPIFQGEGPVPDGRPLKPIRGWLKAQSEYGCTFLYNAFQQRADLAEPAWYAAIQQATCFERGREIAHAISCDYKNYSPDEVDAKFDHACLSPPVGCAYIKEHFPEMACASCPGKAPYHQASKNILDLAQESESGMDQGGYIETLEEVWQFDEGLVSAGVKLGLQGIDDIYTARRGEFTIVAARPSMGKTAWMVDISNRLARQGIPVLRFSGETGRRGLRARDLGWTAGIDTEALRGDRRRGQDIIRLTDEEKEKLNDAAKDLNDLPIYTNYTALDPDKIIHIIEDTLLENKIPLDTHYVVMFDYIQYGVKLQGESNYERVSRLSAQFKTMAKILNCSVIAFAQLGRGAEGEEPNLNDLKESGALEQDADAVMLIHGERDANIKSPRTLLVKKQREGRTGNIEYILHKDTCRFELPYAFGPESGPDVIGGGNPFDLVLGEQ